MTYVTQTDTPNTRSAQWTTLQASGLLLLDVSGYEYAIFGRSHSDGRWPRTDESRRYAGESFPAYSHWTPAGRPVA